MNARDSAAKATGATAGLCGVPASANPYTSPARRQLWEDARDLAVRQEASKPPVPVRGLFRQPLSLAASVILATSR